MVSFWVFTVYGGFTRSMVIFRKLFSQCNIYKQLQPVLSNCQQLLTVINIYNLR